jgi:uncharacterized protein YutD
MLQKKQLAIGSNGYFFIDSIRVDKEEFDRERLNQELSDVKEKLDYIIKYITC